MKFFPTVPLSISLVRQGFKAVVESEKRFNVICVTKRNTVKNSYRFHLNITGEAVVKRVLFTRGDVDVSNTVVTFNGKDYDLCHIRNGLGGSAVVLGILNEDDESYNEWELYTDTPSAQPDGPDPVVVTSKELRECARRSIAYTIARRC